MNDNNTQYYVGSTMNAIKNVPSTKQTEIKSTNNKISMPSVCFFCNSKVRNYSYLVETIYDIDLTTYEYTDKKLDVVLRGVICTHCKMYKTHALLIMLKDGIDMIEQGVDEEGNYV